MKPRTVFEIPNKIRWKTMLSQSGEHSFYPSVARKIRNADARFQEVFEIQDNVADKSTFLSVFIPLYDKEIVSRVDYHLNRETHIQMVLDRIEAGTEYRLFGIYEKANNAFAGGYIYTVRDTMVAAAFRVFDRATTQKYKFNITADYWVEAKFLEFIKQYQKPLFTHGRDTHPREGIGLFLFKCKVGAKPFLTHEEDVVFKTFSEDEFLHSEQPVFFFDEPHSSGEFTHAHLFYNPSTTNMSVIDEFHAVLDWAQISLTTHSFNTNTPVSPQVLD